MRTGCNNFYRYINLLRVKPIDSFLPYGIAYKYFNMTQSKFKNNCDDEAGKLMPVVNFNSCGAKEDCVAVCPYDVFEMRPITVEDRAKLNLKGKIKTFFDKRKAYLTDPSLCHACGACVQACPERAIKLAKVP